MEALIQAKGLLSLPRTPQTRLLRPSHGFKSRLHIPNNRTLNGFSLSASNNPNPIQSLTGSLLKQRKIQSFGVSPYGLSCRRGKEGLQTCRADATVGGEAVAGEPEKPKILGVEVLTLKKIVPLGLMFFCILFNYTILRDTKDVLVVTAKGSSAEIIPFLKTWVNLPMAVGFMLLYTKLSNVLSKEALFYTVIVPFIAFFGAFGFLLYPLSGVIHPTALADRLLGALGPSFLGPVAILRIWSFCLFYVMAELWGSVVISVLFWGFANQITTVEEAKQFYPLFGLGANIALIFSGRTVKYFSNLRKNLGPGVDGWAVSLKGMMSIVVLWGLLFVRSIGE
ncbi:hypothetical protein QJS10_CPB22g01029 [Acorus calamus]|uniref:ADP,ATP carrier protein n=1 Tax=Acorus calamus TaxID=4465 RepID=A0AAV9BY24_ACOCL|nr:hypothetical protein QJS10_CPB22g01029 [Acorus calamus]